jgi:hypothetical protein
VYLPKCLIIPNRHLFDAGNICNDSIHFVNCKQIHQVITEGFILEETELLNTLNKNKNIYVIYAENELVSPIPVHILLQIKQLFILENGLHMDFINTLSSSNFFSILTNIILQE